MTHVVDAPLNPRDHTNWVYVSSHIIDKYELAQIYDRINFSGTEWKLEMNKKKNNHKSCLAESLISIS